MRAPTPAGRSARSLATSRSEAKAFTQETSPRSRGEDCLPEIDSWPPSKQHESRPAAQTENILSVNNIEVIYDHVILVLKGVSLDVPKGGIVALLGANGAGKTTTLKAISNLLHAERGDVTKGSILFDGDEVQDLSPNELVRRGCIQVMEGRHCFAPSHHRGKPAHRRVHAPRRQGRDPRDIDLVYGYFPKLAERRRLDGRLHLRRRAADVRRRPRADVAPEDDPARRAVDGAGAADRRGDFRDRARTSTRRKACRSCSPSRTPTWRCDIARYGYILENGRVVMDGDAKSLAENEDVKEFYLGISEGRRKTFRDGKHYRRRKRWLA